MNHVGYVFNIYYIAYLHYNILDFLCCDSYAK